MQHTTGLPEDHGGTEPAEEEKQRKHQGIGKPNGPCCRQQRKQCGGAGKTFQQPVQRYAAAVQRDQNRHQRQRQQIQDKCDCHQDFQYPGQFLYSGLFHEEDLLSGI